MKKTKWDYVTYEIPFAQKVSPKDAVLFINELGVIIRDSKTGKIVT